MAKKVIIDMGNYLYSTKEQEARYWCIKNGIYISPLAKSTLEWYICIEMNKKISVSPESYRKMEIWKKMYEFYIYYYEKYKK